MKHLVIVSGLVMNMTMSAMNIGRTAEGAAPLEISPEVAQMPDRPLRGSPKPKASPKVREEIQESFRKQHEAFLARQKAEAEKNNNQ